MIERDNTPIFSVHAQKYWDAGLPVIPLHYHEKRPVILQWQQFSDKMPTDEERENWLRYYPNCNMGLVLGQQSGICIVDIDTDDPSITAIFDAILPPSPWIRVGKKGSGRAYKWTGHENFQIKTVAHGGICDFLSTGRQLVLPPSIHPDTKEPYVANSELYEVLDDLYELHPDIEGILREALKDSFEGTDKQLSLTGSTKVTDWVPAGVRDISMTKMSGLYAYAVLRGERTLKEAIELMYSWASEQVQRVAGDPLDIDKGIRNLINFLIRDVVDRGKILPKGWDDGLSDEDKTNMGLNFNSDHQEWSVDEMKSHLQRTFEQYDKGHAQINTAVMYILKKMTISSEMEPLDQERIFQYIAHTSGLGVNVSALRRQYQQMLKGEISGTDHTEIAKEVISQLEEFGKVKFHGSQFWEWNGANWSVLAEHEIRNIISNNFGSMAAAKRASDHKGIMDIIANHLTGDIKTEDEISVNFANGVLTADGELRKHRSEYGFSYVLPFRYLPEEADKASRFMKFLQDCWGDDEDFEVKKMALQEAICATMFGIASKYQHAFLLHGVSRSGKSQLLRIVEELLPESSRCTCHPEDWGDRFKPVVMHEKLINICGELSAKKQIDGSRFKSIVVGDPIDAQFKGKQVFSFKPQCAHWFASNHLPKSDDPSSGFTRRWLIFGFNKQVSGDDMIRNLGETIIKEEREAIAAWAVAALPRLLSQATYTIPSSHEELIQDTAYQNDSVRFFIQGSGRVKVTGSPEEKQSNLISENKLHSAYCNFALMAASVRPVGIRVFRSRMKEIGVELGFKDAMRITSNGIPEHIYIGVILKDVAKAA